MHAHILLYSGTGREASRTATNHKIKKCEPAMYLTRVDRQLAESHFKRRPNPSRSHLAPKFPTKLSSTPRRPKDRRRSLRTESPCDSHPSAVGKVPGDADHVPVRPRGSTDGKPPHLGLGGRTADGWCALSVSSKASHKHSRRRLAPARSAAGGAPLHAARRDERRGLARGAPLCDPLLIDTVMRSWTHLDWSPRTQWGLLSLGVVRTQLLCWVCRFARLNFLLLDACSSL